MNPHTIQHLFYMIDTWALTGLLSNDHSAPMYVLGWYLDHLLVRQPQRGARARTLTWYSQTI